MRANGCDYYSTPPRPLYKHRGRVGVDCVVANYSRRWNPGSAVPSTSCVAVDPCVAECISRDHL